MGRKDFFLHGTYLQKTLRIRTYVVDRLHLIPCLTSFPSIDHLLRPYAWFLMLFHHTDEVISINPPTNVFVFGDFNAHHKDQLTYPSGTDRPVELCY